MGRSYRGSVMAFHAHAAQPVFRQPRQGRVGVIFLHLGQRRAGLVPLLQFVMGVTDLEQRIRRLWTFRKPVDQGLERRQRDVVIARDVIGLTQPVLRIVRIFTVRVLSRNDWKSSAASA